MDVCCVLCVRCALCAVVNLLVQVSTDLSPTNPYTTLIPLCVVFFITIIKQGIEDFKRHQADTAMNNRVASVRVVVTRVTRVVRVQCSL